MNESDKLLDEWQDADESALSVEQEVLADMDEEKSISIFRLKLRRKLLEAQLHGDHSEDCKEEALFNEQVVLVSPFAAVRGVLADCLHRTSRTASRRSRTSIKRSAP